MQPNGQAALVERSLREDRLMPSESPQSPDSGPDGDDQSQSGPSSTDPDSAPTCSSACNTVNEACNVCSCDGECFSVDNLDGTYGNTCDSEAGGDPCR